MIYILISLIIIIECCTKSLIIFQQKKRYYSNSVIELKIELNKNKLHCSRINCLKKLIKIIND